MALRIYTSRLIGADPALVLHGGGNTSVKGSYTTLLDDEVEAIFVKGSGWDLDRLEPAGISIRTVRGFGYMLEEHKET